VRTIIAAQPVTTSKLVFASQKTGRAFSNWGDSRRHPGANLKLLT
jgi:hypothetical protein